MSGMDLAGSSGGDEPTTTIDEQFRALMEGIRTSLPGAQVLFAFLLTAPLQSRFADVTELERAAFAVAFYSSGIASVLLIAPSVHQRVRAPITGLPRRSKRHLIWATWVAIVGSIAMGVAMLATVLLVSRLMFGSSVALAATVLSAAVVTWSWFYLPIVTFSRTGRSGPGVAGDEAPSSG